MRIGLTLLLACAALSPALAQEAEQDKFELVSLSRKVNTQYHDSAPVVSPDGKTLYFTVSDHPENTKGKGSQDIWYSEVDATGNWSQAKHMPDPLNRNQVNSVLSVSPDGNTLLVRGSGKDGLGFSLCKRVNGVWQKPEPLKIDGFEKMAKGRFNGAFLALDASALLLYFNEKEGAKYSDLYVSFPSSNGKSWSRPEPIAGLNTRQDEFGPFIAPDNKTLYFASNRHGGFGNADIYKTTRLDNSWQKWSKPENLGAPINTGGFDAYYSIGNSDTLVFTTRAYMSADGGHLDIHTLRRVHIKKAKIMLTGRVVDIKSGMAIPAANVRIVQQAEPVGVAVTEGAEHEFAAQLPGPGEFRLEVDAEGYLAGADTFAVEPTTTDMSVYRTIYLKKLEVGLSVRLNNIFFDFDKTSLRPESYPELDKVVALMEQNPGLFIEIGGHTDDKGSDAYNETLSQGRAEAVMQYITSQFIEPARVTARGYGESKPEVANDTDENRQINRRVEFTILQNTARQ